MRVAVLWYGLTGYLNACLKALSQQPNVELFVAHKKAHAEAPYEEDQFAWISQRYYWKSYSDLAGLRSQIEIFNPDAIVMVGWRVPEYREIAEAYKGRAVRIMTMDNNWLNTPRQWLGILSSRLYIKPYVDAVWVPGERQAAFATRMGFIQSTIIRGLYSCDHESFTSVHLSRTVSGKSFRRRFLFVGRFSEEKGIAILSEAYRRYREKMHDPWPLLCCGTGPLEHLLKGQDGVQLEGFVQPFDLPSKFGECGCLILPSNFEPWGVVVHEAVSAGLIVLASAPVGATPHLVQYNYNGFVFDPGDALALAEIMIRISNAPTEKLENMSAASYSLSQQFTPKLWASSLVAFCKYQSKK